MSLSSRIASIGENVNFVAFMAHSGFAFFVMIVAWLAGAPLGVTAGFCVVLALMKEFWFDLRYETTPPQTVWNSMLDFIGYMTGLALAFLMIKLN